MEPRSPTTFSALPCLQVPGTSKSASKPARPHKPRPGSPPVASGGGADAAPAAEDAVDLGMTSSGGQTVKEDAGAEAPKKSRGRKKRVVAEKQPEGGAPGRKRRRRRKVEQQRGAPSLIWEQLSSSSPPQTSLCLQTSLEAPAPAPDSRPAPEGAERSSEVEGGPVTTVTRHCRSFEASQQTRASRSDSLFLQVGAEPQKKKKPSSPAGAAHTPPDCGPPGGGSNTRLWLELSGDQSR